MDVGNGQAQAQRRESMYAVLGRLLPAVPRALLEPEASRAPRFMGLQFQLPGQEEILTASGEMMSLQSEKRDGKSVGVRVTNWSESNERGPIYAHLPRSKFNTGAAAHSQPPR